MKKPVAVDGGRWGGRREEVEEERRRKGGGGGGQGDGVVRCGAVGRPQLLVNSDLGLRVCAEGGLVGERASEDLRSCV